MSEKSVEEIGGPIEQEVEGLIEREVGEIQEREIELLEKIRQKVIQAKQGGILVKGKGYQLKFLSNGDVELEKLQEQEFPTLDSIVALWSSGEKIDIEEVSPIFEGDIMKVIEQLLREGEVELY